MATPYEEEKKEEVPDIKYTEEERAYRAKLINWLFNSHEVRESIHDEFDGMGYTQRWNEDERKKNIYIPPRLNKQDANVVTGTTRQKIMGFAAAINNLNLLGDITAFDNHTNLIIPALGESMEGILRKTEELEMDEIKRLNRTIELIAHGELFVEEIVYKDYEVKKMLKEKFDGRISSAKWVKRLAVSAPKFERNILYGPGVYLGDITQFDIQMQPYIFTVEIMPYEKVKSMYGEWERFKFVSQDLKAFSPNPVEATTQYNRNWSLTQLQKDHVEVVKMQDKWNNEYMVMLNGVMMMPVGFPLPWGARYNIAHQVLEPISPYFAYGKSLPSKFRTLDAVLDEMLRLMVLKTQKSYAPTIANLTGRVLSPSIYMPGKILNGVDPDGIKQLFPDMEGVSNSEFQMFQEVQKQVDNNSISPQFQGQESRQAGQTATEVLNRQRQAEVQLGLTIFACSMMEKKLTLLRIPNILEHWFDPVDTKIDEIRNELVNVYQNISVESPIEGEGRGELMINIVEGAVPLTAQQIRDQEKEISTRTGKPVRIAYIDATKIKDMHTASRLLFRVNVVPKPKQSSELQQIMFRNMLVDAQFFGPDLNKEYLKEKFALTWNETPGKLFNPNSTPPGMEQVLAGGVSAPGGVGAGSIAKKVGEMNAAGGVKTPSITGGGI